MTAIDYNSIAGQYHRNRRTNLAILSDLVEGSGIGPSSRVLEVGCGTGNYISAIAGSIGCRCWGIDPSERMLAHADLESHPSLVLQMGFAEGIAFPERFFDFIFSVDVIHHVADRPAYLGRARRQLCSEGRLCTVTDSEEMIRAREPLSRYFPESVAVELRRYPAIKTLKEELRAAGFTRIWETATEMPYQVSDLTPFRDKAYSSLHLITPEAHQRGLARMEKDLGRGPIRGLARYCHLWAA